MPPDATRPRVAVPPATRPRVAMVGLRAPWGTEGGVEQAVGELAPRLVDAGFAVTVYCRSRYNPLGNGTHRGVRLQDSPTAYARGLEAFAHSAVAVPRAARAHDLVHVHACGPGLFAGLPRLAGRATVVTLHGKDWERGKWGPAARALLRAGAEAAVRTAHAVIAVSEELAEWARERASGPVFHIPNGVGAHRPVPWDAARFPDLEPGRYLLSLGRLVPEKGLDVLVDAAQAMGTPMPVVVVGGPADTERWVAAQRARAPGHVRFLGPRFDDDKAMLLTHARAFVFPSRTEGLSIALLEALAAGLPTVTTDIAANREVLGDLGGWRVPAGDSSALTAALDAVTGAADLALLGEAGRRRVADTFTWEAATAATAAVYRQVLGGAGGG